MIYIEPPSFFGLKKGNDNWYEYKAILDFAKENPEYADSNYPQYIKHLELAVFKDNIRYDFQLLENYSTLNANCYNVCLLFFKGNYDKPEITDNIIFTHSKKSRLYELEKVIRIVGNYWQEKGTTIKGGKAERKILVKSKLKNKPYGSL